MICFWGAYRPARGIGSEQVFRLPVAGWLIETLGGIPFPKGAKDGEAIRKLVAAYEEASDSAASADFTTCLHQGDPLGAAAVRVPKDIPVFQVDEWDQAAVHALEEKDPLLAPAPTPAASPWRTTSSRRLWSTSSSGCAR
jgi:hypothetical protein